MRQHSPAEVRSKTEMVKKIIKHHFGTAPKDIQFKPAGLTNFVFDATCKAGQYIVRIGNSGKKMNDYLKEQWAVDRVREKGVPVAEIFEVDNEVIGLPYMLQQKLEGKEAVNHPDRLAILHELGRLTRLIHSIPTSNFGSVFDWSKNRLSKNDTWKAYLHDELEIHRRLEILGKNKMLEKKRFVTLKKAIEKVEKLNVSPVLNHGDIRLKNVIIDDTGKILALIDWENCTSHMAPYWDFSIALHDLSMDGKQHFLQGYGLDLKDYAPLAFTIKVFNILNYTDEIEVLIKKKELQLLEYYRLRLNGYFDLFSF